eukprot:403363358
MEQKKPQKSNEKQKEPQLQKKFSNNEYSSMLSSPTRRLKLKDLELKVLKFAENQYQKMEQLKSQKSKQSKGRRIGNSILTHMEDSDDSSEEEIDLEELQTLIRAKLIDIKNCFDKVQDTVNENSRLQMILIRIVKDDFINHAKLGQIFKELNETYAHSQNTVPSQDNKDQEPAELNVETQKHLQNYKSLLKDLIIFKEHLPKYEYDKKNFNLRINDRVRQQDFKSELSNLETKMTNMIDERLSNLENWLQEAKKVTTEKVQEIEDKQTNLEKNIQWRITDCEQLLKSRVNEKYVQDYGQIIQENVLKKLQDNDSDSMVRLAKVQQDISTKFENQDIALEEKLQLFKKMQFDLEKKINLKTDKALVNKMMLDAKESKQTFDQQFEMMQKGYQSFDLRNKDNQLKIQQLFQYQEERDQAIKNIPKNVEVILHELDVKLQEQNLKLNQLDIKLTHKVEIEQNQFDLSRKLDVEQFYKWFPQDMLPADYFQSYIKKESLLIQQNILDMAKMWDSKLVKLRQDMNIHSIIKKIGEKAEQQDVKEAFEGQTKRIDQIEENFIQIINEVEGLNMKNQMQIMQIQDIHSRQQEVLIGKRNVNCLSCAQDPPETSIQGKDGIIYRNASLNEGVSQNLFDVQAHINQKRIQTAKRLKHSSANLSVQRYNRSHQLSRQDSPESLTKVKLLNEKILSAYSSQVNTQAMTSQNRNYDDFNTRTNSQRHLRSISSVINDSAAPILEQRLTNNMSYIENGNYQNSNSNNNYSNNSTFVYESGQELDKIRGIIRGKNGSGGKSKFRKYNNMTDQGSKQGMKRKHPFALLALNEMKNQHQVQQQVTHSLHLNLN